MYKSRYSTSYAKFIAKLQIEVWCVFGWAVIVTLELLFSLVTPLADYYVLGGTVYQCPDIWSIINSRLVSSSLDYVESSNRRCWSIKYVCVNVPMYRYKKRMVLCPNAGNAKFHECKNYLRTGSIFSDRTLGRSYTLCCACCFFSCPPCIWSVKPSKSVSE